jgi:hypothetical protein
MPPHHGVLLKSNPCWRTVQLKKNLETRAGATPSGKCGCVELIGNIAGDRPTLATTVFGIYDVFFNSQM